MTIKRVSIRDMDAKTWDRAVLAALKAKKSMADWTREAFQDKLNKRKEKRENV